MYTVGQKLWLVPIARRGNPSEVTVTKVGRKWLTLNNGHRANVDSLELDGGQYISPGSCYLTKEDWEAETELNEAWIKLRRDFDNSHRVPYGVTVQCINEVRKLIFNGFVYVNPCKPY